ncbi:ABC transporter substrate-binding protein [Alicyclobacillus fodiniaquatilis]|uniref:ABC transporter substrate-binding protein n=1 Tax=Alicyclobacillus fodiniaquatilis TaxID=1661150 RepID=A0ABW4JL65_9BACL
MKISRVAASALTLALTLGTVGCGQASNNANGKKITITLWYWNQSLSDQILAQVDKAFPNVHFVAEKIGGNFESKLIASLYAGDAPDITGINSADFVATMVKDHNQFVNLNQYPEVREAQKNYLGWKWNLASTPDHKYQVGIPIDTGPEVLYYNTQLFKKAGLPTDPAQVSEQMKTWSDYLAAGKQMKEKTGVPMVDDLTTIYQTALNQGKTNYFTPNMTPIYATNPVVKNAWDLVIQAHQEGLSANIAEGTTSWSAGLSHNGFASFIGASWEVPDLEQGDTRKGVWRVAAAPGGPSDNGGSFLGVTKDSKHPELAAKIVLWILDAQHQTEMYPSLGLYPSTPASFPHLNQPNAYFGGENINKYFAACDKQIKIAFQSPYDSTVNGYFTQQVSLIDSSNKNPEVAWKDAINESNSQMKRILD